MSKPFALPPALVPLASEPRWLVWKWQKNKNGKLTKPPFDARQPQRHASSTDPGTWCSFEIAQQTCSAGKADGIGFALLYSGLGAFDIDNCRDAKTGKLHPWARDMVRRAGSYAEITPSESGIRIIGRASGSSVHRKLKVPGANGMTVEPYRNCERYITITGDTLPESAVDLADIGPHIDAVVAELDSAAAQTTHAMSIPRPLEALIRDGCGDDFGGDRSRAVWFVIHEMMRRGETAEAIAKVLLDRSNQISDHVYDQVRPAQYVQRQIDKAQRQHEAEESSRAVRLEDFVGYMPQHTYIFKPTRETWPGSSVNSRVGPVPMLDVQGRPVLGEDGKPKRQSASAWLDANAPVEQMTWAPGEPMLIEDRLIAEGGWIQRPGCTVFNLYRPPEIELGNALEAEPWLDHIHRIYPDDGDADHIIGWLAHRVQRPSQKINHALVLGGLQGVGKDTLLEPVKHAIGPWNFSEVSPRVVLGRFNGFTKSVILRISEARDLGDLDRFSLYDHMKAYTAAPPDVLRVDEKHLREYAVLNVCGVVITTNHKTDGIYLPEDDRRHYVTWCNLTKESFAKGYWPHLWRFYRNGGFRHVAAYLSEFELSRFDPKAPPPKTPAFWEIVDANRAPEDAEMADVLDALDRPKAVTLAQIISEASGDFQDWLRDRRNARRIPFRLEACGYAAVRNPTDAEGRWKIKGRRHTIYALAALSVRDRIVAAQELVRCR